MWIQLILVLFSNGLDFDKKTLAMVDFTCSVWVLKTFQKKFSMKKQTKIKLYSKFWTKNRVKNMYTIPLYQRFFLTLYRWKPKYTTSSAKASAKEIPIGIPYRELLFPYREFPIGTLVWLFSQTRISIGNPYREFPIGILVWLFSQTRIYRESL